MQYELLLLGKTKGSFLLEGMEEYVKRLQHYTRFRLRTLKTKAVKGSDRQIREKEGELLLANVPQGAKLVALDSRGKQLPSPDFAELVSSWENSGVGQVNFVIGGPLGLSETVLSQASLVLSLSRMTFTHDMTRLLLVEQLYRAYTIKAGERYHK